MVTRKHAAKPIRVKRKIVRAQPLPEAMAKLMQAMPHVSEMAPNDSQDLEERLTETISKAQPLVGTTGNYVDPNGVHHPLHYNNHPSGVEANTIMEYMSANIGQVIKYVWRAGLKPGQSTLRDLEKAKWYLEAEISRVQRDTVRHSNMIGRVNEL